MHAEKKVLGELKCTLCGDVFRSDIAQQRSSVKQKASELTCETVRRHRWLRATNGDGTAVGWVCSACWKTLERSG
jgi:hypothetical protein